MNTNDLNFMREVCKKQLLEALKLFVVENGEEMCDYFRDEHGIDDENVVKVLDLFCEGCHFAVPIKYRTESEDDYEHHAFWTLYVVNEDGELELKYYQFSNMGLKFSEEDCEPDHDYARNLSLAELEYIYSHVMDVYK